MDRALTQADQNLSEGKLDHALGKYQTIVTIDSQNALAFEGLGRTLCRLGRHDEAISAYRKALDINPELAIPHADLGNIYYIRRQFSESVKEYRQAIELNPKLFAPYTNLVNILTKKGQIEEAEIVAKQAIEHDLQRAVFYCYLIEIYLRQKRFVVAIDAVYQAFHLSPKMSTVFKIAWATVRAYPKQMVYVIEILLFLITLSTQPAIAMLIGLGLFAGAVLESVPLFRSGACKQAVIITIFAFLMLLLSTSVYLVSVMK